MFLSIELDVHIDTYRYISNYRCREIVFLFIQSADIWDAGRELINESHAEDVRTTFNRQWLTAICQQYAVIFQEQLERNMVLERVRGFQRDQEFRAAVPLRMKRYRTEPDKLHGIIAFRRNIAAAHVRPVCGRHVRVTLSTIRFVIANRHMRIIKVNAQ